jgi:hypothetical protein
MSANLNVNYLTKKKTRHICRVFSFKVVSSAFCFLLSALSLIRSKSHARIICSYSYLSSTSI